MKWNVARWFLAPYKGTVAHSHKFAPKIFRCYAAVFQSSLPSNLPRPSPLSRSRISFFILDRISATTGLEQVSVGTHNLPNYSKVTFTRKIQC